MSATTAHRRLAPASILISGLGGVGLLALWLSDVHAASGQHMVDCGTVFAKWSSLKTIGGPCHAALTHRWALGFVVIVPTLVLTFAIQARHAGYLGGQRLEPRGSPRIDSTVGARIGWAHASYPLATLSATPEQIVIRFLFATTAIDRSRIQTVALARRAFQTAIEFTAIDGSREHVRVYSRAPQRLLGDLAKLGWPVSGAS